MGEFKVGPKHLLHKTVVKRDPPHTVHVDRIIEKHIEIIKEIPVHKEVFIEVIKEVPTTIVQIVEKIVEIEKPVIIEIEKIVDRPVEIVKEVLNYVERIVVQKHVPSWLFTALWIETTLLVALLVLKLI